MGLPEAKCDVCGTPLPAGAGPCPTCATETGMGTAPVPQIPGFRLLGLLGRGGMGSVYLADDLSLARKVAVKVLAEKYQGNTEARDRFLREARALAGIDHPNVLRIHSLGEASGVAYIVTEFVEGESLARRISRGPLPAAEALRITREAAAGLAAAWEKGIVHRDVKPSNLLLDSAGRVKVADFGLAKPVEVDSSFHTSTGVVMGTPHYVSPEQARGEAVDLRTDIYSLGVALYEMATGKRPFGGATPVEVMAHHLHSPMPPLASAMPRISPALESAISRMTQKRAADRPGSFAELSELLREEGSGGGASARYAAALALALVGGIAYYLKPSPSSPSEATATAARTHTPRPDMTYGERSVDVPPKYLSGGTVDSLREFLPRGGDREGCLGTISVVVEFVVTPGGDVTELEVKSSKVAGGAMLGLSGRKYSPGLKEGTPVRVRLRRRYEVASPFVSLAALRSQVDSIEKGLMPPEFALGCVAVLGTSLNLTDPAFVAEGVRGLTALPRAYTVDDADLDSIGWLLAETSHPTEAMQVFEARLARLPETAREYERIGDGLANIGQRDAALKAYRLALALEPSQASLRKKLDDATSNPTEGMYAGARVFMESEVDTAPSRLNTGPMLPQPRPRMPPGEISSVSLSWIVTLKGEIADLKVQRASGLEIEQYFLGAVEKWRYQPGMKGGIAVPVKVVRRYTLGSPAATAPSK